MATLFTIGHSTRGFDDFVAVLEAHGIQTLVDIRSLPASRRLPHFNREFLEQHLPGRSIAYLWMKELGGRRKKTLAASPHTALRSDSFRNYADHMLSREFQDAAAELVRCAGVSPLAYMCAERMWFQCHRMMVSDYLVAHGHTVLHIDGIKPPRPHKLMEVARMIGGQLIYNGGELF